MEWVPLFFTIALSIVAIVVTIWCGRVARRRLDQMKDVIVEDE